MLVVCTYVVIRIKTSWLYAATTDILVKEYKQRRCSHINAVPVAGA